VVNTGCVKYHWSDSIIVDSWGSRKVGKKKIWDRQAKKLVFWALYVNWFINMFINSLFINQKLKTVYNPLRNYKQDPKLGWIRGVFGVFGARVAVASSGERSRNHVLESVFIRSFRF
jgi:hypothetical protein